MMIPRNSTSSQMFVAPSLLDPGVVFSSRYLHGISTGHRRIMSGAPLCINTRMQGQMRYRDYKEVPGGGGKIAKSCCVRLFTLSVLIPLTVTCTQADLGLVWNVYHQALHCLSTFTATRFRSNCSGTRLPTKFKIVVGHHVPSGPFTVFSKYVCICNGKCWDLQ